MTFISVRSATRPISTGSPADRWATRCRRGCTTPRSTRRGATRDPCPCPGVADADPVAVAADGFLDLARASGIKGASVTIPFKVALFDAIDEVYAVARRIGAINTIRVEGRRWIGGNTDASGFLEPLQQRVALNGLRVAVL